MIQEFVDRFFENKGQLEKFFSEKHPEDYTEIVREVVKTVCGDDHPRMDENRIHVIDDGDYQGTLVYVIGASGYQPYNYWYVKVYYGSCSGCDTLQSINSYSDEPPDEGQVKDYMTLALHIVQGLCKMDGDIV